MNKREHSHQRPETFEEERAFLRLTTSETADLIVRHDLVQAVLEEALPARAQGRPTEHVDVTDALAALVRAALERRTVRFRDAAELLFGREDTTDKTNTVRWPAADETGKERERLIHRCEQILTRRISTLTKATSGYTGPKGSSVTVAEVASWMIRQGHHLPAGRSEQARRDDLLHRLMNAIIQASIDVLPDRLLANMGDTVALDGTFVATYSKARGGHVPIEKIRHGVGRTADSAHDLNGHVAAAVEILERSPSQHLASDPEAGHYVRRDKYVGLGYEAHLAVTYRPGATRGQTIFPTLVLGASLDVPGYRPGTNGIAALRSATECVNSHGGQLTTGVFDGLYPKLSDAEFHVPLRELGLLPVARLTPERMGRIGISYEGLVHIEGAWYCDQIPDRLADASKDREEGRIDDAEYKRRIEQRRLWEAQRITGSAVLDADGLPINHRYECPAARRTNCIGCPLRPDSIQPGRDRVKVQRSKDDPLPKACSQRSVTVPWEIAVAHEQRYPYRTEDWLLVNSLFRSVNEGLNGRIKDPSSQGIRDTACRRVKGKSANGTLLAIQLAAHNVLAAQSFSRSCDLGEQIPTRRYAPGRRKHKVSPDYSTDRRPSARSGGGTRHHPDDRPDGTRSRRR